MLNLGTLVTSLPNPQLLLVGSGGAILVLASTFFMLRRRIGGGSDLEPNTGTTEISDRLLDYISEHQGAISMGKASKDLGVSTEDLDEAIMKLKADGRLPT